VPERRPTIADVARRAGVSKGAVSFALNDRPGVAPRPGPASWPPPTSSAGAEHPRRSLSSSRSYALGLVIARPPHLIAADPFFPAFIAGVESELGRRGHVLVLQMVSDGDAEVEGYRRLVRDGRVDGVFVTDLRHRDRRIALLQELGCRPSRSAGPTSTARSRRSSSTTDPASQPPSPTSSSLVTPESPTSGT